MSRTPDRTREASLAGTTGGQALPEQPIFADGATIGTRYRLSRLIARGGMGEVYAAQDLELGTEVAIKTIRAERIGDPAAVARLKQEILAARKVTHPNVVRLFDVGYHVLDDQREIAFFTMELVAGDTLDARIRAAGKLAPAEALGLATQMAGALDALHAAGIVHRDFKSPNVLVVEDRALVTDFGLARDHHDGAAKTTLFEMVGTPGYMAPEQVTREQQIGPAADIYAFGVVLYEMVTGALPFQRDTALATAAARLEHEPPSPRSLAPALPAAWDAAILRCLRRDPAQRFARASDVVAALTRRAPLPWKPIAIAGAIAAAAIATYALWPRDHAGGAAGACVAPAGPDLYVDATASLGGTGSEACPFRTISDALAVQADRRIVHVAPGFYDRALGERFPLVLRGEVSLVGAGQDLTTISGVGTYDPQPAAGTLGAGAWQASIVVGDATRPIEIAELALAPALASVQSGSVGIACTRGVREGAPNTRVRAVAIGGYGYGIIVGTETAPVETGCNLDVTASRLHDGMTGLWVVGCGNGEGRVGVGARVGDTRFEAFRTIDPMYPGRGIAVWDCARELVVEHSEFVDSDTGLDIIRHAGEGARPMVIRDNDLTGLSRTGITTALSVIADIRGNRFSNVTGNGEFLGHAAAIKVYVDGDQGPSLQVRDNRFVENDVALEVWGIAPLPASVVLDLGRDGDPGGNTFFCNAAPAVSTVPGGDIAIRIAAAPGTRLDLQGNKWDHATPTRSTTPVNGLDILDIKASPLAVDTAGATFHGSEYCMQRRR